LSVGRSVGLSVTVVSRAKIAQPVEMAFGLWTQVGLRNHVLDAGSNRPLGGSNFGGKDMPADLSPLVAANAVAAAGVVVALSPAGNEYIRRCEG